MIRILVVDDEPHVHLLLEREVRWQEAGYELAAFADNGSEALRLLRQARQPFDIVLTDLNMPVMDGFAFLEQAQQLSPRTAFVVLSVYNDYQNIRKAFQLGALDYILKFEVGHDYVTGILDNVRDKLLHRGVGSRLVEQFHLALRGQGGESSALGAFCRDSSLTVCVCDLRHPTDLAARGQIALPQPEMLQICREALPPAGRDSPMAVIDGRVTMLLRGYRSPGYAEWKNQLSLLADAINRQAGKHGARSALGAGDLFDSWGEIPLRYHQATRRAERFFCEERTLFLQDGPPPGELPNVGQAVTRLCDALLQGVDGAALPILQELSDDIRQRHIASRQSIQTFFIQIIFFLRERLNEQGTPASVLSERSEEIGRNVLDAQTLSGLTAYLGELLAAVYSHTGIAGSGREERTVRQILQYMQGNFSQGLTLRQIGEAVGFSENYVSAMLLRVTGRSYSAHLSEIRIVHAKRLLSAGGEKIYEIAARCGYTSAEHFSRSFKKITGVSPAEYKQNPSGALPGNQE